MGELPFDRTVQVSVTDRLEKEQILGRLPHNLDTLQTLLKRNRRDYRIAVSKNQSKSKRQEAWASLARRRRRAVTLDRRAGTTNPSDRADDSHAGRLQPPAG